MTVEATVSAVVEVERGVEREEDRKSACAVRTRHHPGTGAGYILCRAANVREFETTVPFE
jgi:hypothetical protein